jgi:DNA-binding Lrp family transcriptional regulator
VDSYPRAQVSGRQRPGRRFAPIAELALVHFAKQAAAELPGAAAGLLALSELHAPYGVPDLTVVVGQPALRRSRLRLHVPPLLNEIDAGIVSALSDSRLSSTRQLAQRLSWSLPTIERRLRTVVRTGAVREVVPKRYKRPTALQPVGTVFAVETKLSDWRRALTQCRTYRTWADSYVLVMGRTSRDALTMLREEVARDGGGLLLNGEWIVRPRVNKLSHARRLWTSEHVIAACKRPTTSLRLPRRA